MIFHHPVLLDAGELHEVARPVQLVVVLLGVGQDQLVAHVGLVSHLVRGRGVERSKEQGARRDIMSRRISADPCEVVVPGAV